MNDAVSNDYINYIFSEYPIESISLPYNQSINKYTFLQKISSVLPFGGRSQQNFDKLTADCIDYVLGQFLYTRNTCDKSYYDFYNIVIGEFIEVCKKYLLVDALSVEKTSCFFIKVAILCENIYLNNGSTYKFGTTSYEIDHVLSVIEKNCGYSGIYTTNKPYDFNNVMDLVIAQMRNKYNKMTIFKKKKHEQLEKQMYMVYFEALFLVANEYNNQILKEQSCNEW